ncbi:helix-turn-helix domain-containing protein [Candidatus Saccharibacteria bacterium]|nr:helix-turn-helix domain-containing protein [Candidatus Saccharibacteria bacterium]
MGKSYHYTLCGLPDVYLVNGYKIETSPYGGETISIENIKGLHEAIGVDIISQPGRLRPEQIKFLRKEMGLSQHLLATLIEVSEVTYRKWESASDRNQIKGPADKLLRAIYARYIGQDEKLKSLLDTAIELDHKIIKSGAKEQFQQALRTFEETDAGWMPQAADC